MYFKNNGHRVRYIVADIQGWVCPISGYKFLYDDVSGEVISEQKSTPKSQVAAIDHDHDTGLVRGLLCRYVNGLIGRPTSEAWYGDTISNQILELPNIKSYLEMPPMMEAGIELYYGSYTDKKMEKIFGEKWTNLT